MLLFHGEAASSAVEDASVSYQSPSIIAAGANAQTVSILAMLINLCLALVCFKAPAIIERLGLTRKGAYTLAFLNLCTWVPLTLTFLISNLGVTPILVAALWLINIIPGILLTYQRDNWLSNIVPQDTLGRYLGQRMAIKSAFYLGAFFSLGYLLDLFGKKGLVSFGFVFIIASTAVLIYYIIFTVMYEPKNTVTGPDKLANQKIRFGLFDYLSELKKKKLDSFITFASLFYLSVGLSGPLYAVYMLQERNFSYMSFVLVISAEYLARVVSTPLWGRFADKEGNIRVLSIVSRVIPIIPICWLFCSNIGYLAFIQILSGTCWGAFDLCTQSYLYKVAPQPKKLRYIVYSRCLILFSTAMGGLLGALCVNNIFPTFGSKILSIFLLSGIARIGIVMYLMPKLVDLAMSYGQHPNPPEVDLDTLHRVLASKRGQFYHKQPAEPPAFIQRMQLEEEASSKLKHHAGSRKWGKHEKPVQSIPEPVVSTKPVNLDLRLDHYRGAMAAIAAKKPAVVYHSMTEQSEERLKLRYDLERQLNVLSARAEEAMSHHAIEDNVERLKMRYHLDDRQSETAAALAEKAIAHHGIQQNIERLKLRYELNRQPVSAIAGSEKVISHHGIEQNIERLKVHYNLNLQPEGTVARAVNIPVKVHPVLKIDTEKVKSSTGLYRDKVSWAKYVKNTFDTVLKERQVQPIPVMAGSYNEAGVP